MQICKKGCETKAHPDQSSSVSVSNVLLFIKNKKKNKKMRLVKQSQLKVNISPLKRFGYPVCVLCRLMHSSENGLPT